MINTWYGRGFEHVLEVVIDPNHFFMRAPSGQTVPGYGTPKPLVSPFGPHYSMHPELSRPAIGMLMSQAAVPAAFFVAPLVLFELNRAIIQDAPEHEQRGLWQMFSSGLTGTFGGDYSGLI